MSPRNYLLENIKQSLWSHTGLTYFLRLYPGLLLKKVKKSVSFLYPHPHPPPPPIPDKQVFRFFTESAKLLFPDNLKNTASILKEPTPTGVSKN